MKTQINKKIVLITTGQPSCNPRIVKEADALQNAGFEVTVLYSFFIDWAQEKDNILLENVMWKYKMVGGSKKNKKIVYFFSRVWFKANRFLNKYVTNNFLIAERSQARVYDGLLNEAIKIKAEWYIGHNLGALPIALKAAKYHNAKAGFDFEDYHRGEDQDKSTLKRIIFLENKYVPALSYYSTASEFITKITSINHPIFLGKTITLLNCFPLTQQPVFKKKATTEDKLNLFWFSQTIGLNRGIETLIDALKFLNNKSIHLTLAGRSDDEMINYINNHAGPMISNIHFAGIIQPENLPSFAAQFDVGMAIELSETRNHDICLSNKIFTYLLAGNGIILSQTSMQLAFNKEYKIGESFVSKNVNELAEKINIYLDIEKLNKQKTHNYDLAKNKLNWENEFPKLLVIIN